MEYAQFTENDEILGICDNIAYRHFPESNVSARNTPYAFYDNTGKPVPIAQTELNASPEYNLQQPAQKLHPRRPFDEIFAVEVQSAMAIIAKAAPEIAQALVDLAKGIKVIRTDEFGNEIEVYQTKPDIKAVGVAFERLMGKPTEYRQIEETKTVTEDKRVTIYIPDNQRSASRTQVAIPEIAAPNSPNAPHRLPVDIQKNLDRNQDIIEGQWIQS